jgi:hypothetical protein
MARPKTQIGRVCADRKKGVLRKKRGAVVLACYLSSRWTSHNMRHALWVVAQPRVPHCENFLCSCRDPHGAGR